MWKPSKKNTFETTLFTFSHSGLSIMEKCPRKWFYRYIKGFYCSLKQPWTDFGLLVHTVAENYKGGGKEEVQSLIKKYMFYERGIKQGEKRWIIEGDYYKNRAQVAFKNLIQFYDAYLKNAKYLKFEKEFRGPITPYLDMTGKVDVLYKSEEDEWIIVDYKTSKQKSDHNIQLAFYFYLMNWCQNKNVKNLKCLVVYLGLESLSTDLDDIVEEYNLDLTDLEFNESRLQAGINRIANCGYDKNKWRKKPTKLCDFCEYKAIGLCSGEADEE